jgi:hypothetical protein
MMKLGLTLWCTLAILGFANNAAAQWYPAGSHPVRSLDRWLGIGYGPGYHSGNPGPDSDYYQPYSDLNSGLQSWLPTESGIQSEPAESPDDSPAPNYSPQSMRPRVGLERVSSGKWGASQQERRTAGAFGWESRSDPSQRVANEPRNLNFSSGPPRAERTAGGSRWR